MVQRRHNERLGSQWKSYCTDNYINISVDTDTAFETDGDTNDAIITVEYSSIQSSTNRHKSDPEMRFHRP